jgi:hypothetical protein
MRIQELLEMTPPYWAKGEKPPKHWRHALTSFMSLSALARDFKSLNSTIDLPSSIGESISFFQNTSTKTVIGGFESYNEESLQIDFEVVFTLRFKKKNTLLNIPNDIPSKKLIQVDKVLTSKDYANFGIASFVYAALVRSGHFILSDITQLDGGKALWQRMARLAHLSDYQIRILDDERGYLKDKNGKVISYDNSNIHEDDIWTTLLDFSGEHKLLLISPKL